MSAIKNVIYDIQSAIRAGKISFEGIAKLYNVPKYFVEQVFEEMMAEECEE